MRLNAKRAKDLRAAAEYRNQSATPSHPEFPGIARFYTMPVYMTRPALKSSYERREGRMVRVLRRVTSMRVVARRGKEPTIPFLMEEQAHPSTITLKDGTEVAHPKAGQKFMGPKLDLVPVTKPVSAKGAKKVYRQLKRLHKMGLFGPRTIAADFQQFLREQGVDHEA